jgi:all-trans-retinol dehydrogenase (NAD+)
MTKISRKTILITGGAGGIGKLMASRFLAKKAAHVVLWDINEDALNKTVADFKKEGYHQVSAYKVDVANTKEIEKTATETMLEHGAVDILINNAGIVPGKKLFSEHSVADIDRTLDINTSAVMHVTRVFMPDMLRRKAGHIVNISSASAYIGNPNMSVYAASKWAVLGWSESLRLEMETEETGIQITTICPSYIDTGMFNGVSAPLLFPLLKPNDIVDKIINAIEKNQDMVMAPDMVNAVPFLKGVLGRKLFDKVAGLIGVYNSMSTFEGRPEVKKKEKVVSEK